MTTQFFRYTYRDATGQEKQERAALPAGRDVADYLTVELARVGYEYISHEMR